MSSEALSQLPFAHLMPPPEAALQFHTVFIEILTVLQQLNQPGIRVYTIPETADLLKCKIRTVKHHLYESRDLPYLKVGREVRIREEDLKQFLANQLTLCL